MRGYLLGTSHFFTGRILFQLGRVIFLWDESVSNWDSSVSNWDGSVFYGTDPPPSGTDPIFEGQLLFSVGELLRWLVLHLTFSSYRYRSTSSSFILATPVEAFSWMYSTRLLMAETVTSSLGSIRKIGASRGA